MKLSGLQEIKRWILGWGGDAKVVRPPKLVELVRHSAQRILGVQS